MNPSLIFLSGLVLGIALTSIFVYEWKRTPTAKDIPLPKVETKPKRKPFLSKEQIERAYAKRCEELCKSFIDKVLDHTFILKHFSEVQFVAFLNKDEAKILKECLPSIQDKLYQEYRIGVRNTSYLNTSSIEKQPFPFIVFYTPSA